MYMLYTYIYVYICVYIKRLDYILYICIYIKPDLFWMFNLKICDELKSLYFFPSLYIGPGLLESSVLCTS